MAKLELIVNGEEVKAEVSPKITLQKFLHDELGLKGTKESCGSGVCGACTVLVDGKAVKSCIILAIQVNGRKVQTIEGLAQEDELHPLQKSFIEHGASQCGYCTPGMIMSAKALLDERPTVTEKDVRFALSGNLCRCTGYHKIVKAILAVANERRP